MEPESALDGEDLREWGRMGDFANEDVVPVPYMPVLLAPGHAHKRVVNELRSIVCGERVCARVSHRRWLFTTAQLCTCVPNRTLCVAIAPLGTRPVGARRVQDKTRAYAERFKRTNMPSTEIHEELHALRHATLQLAFEEPPPEPASGRSEAEKAELAARKRQFDERRKAQAHLTPYEAASLLSLVPDSLAEAEALLPTLKRFADPEQLEAIISRIKSRVRCLAHNAFCILFITTHAYAMPQIGFLTGT